MRLLASMIVRDELARYQPLLCQHLLTFCDEIRVLDDCSTDGTAAALEAIDPRVKVKAVVGNSVWDLWGEGGARQQLLDWTMQGRPEHVLAIDADEFVPHGLLLRDCIRRNPDAEIFTLRMVEVWRREGLPWQIRVDGGWAPRDVPVCWRVPLDSRADGVLPNGWEISPRRLACGREPEMVAAIAAMGDAVTVPDVDICHLGWSDPTTRRARYERYMELDGGRFHADAHLQSILSEPTLEPYPPYPRVLSQRTSS